MSLSTIFHERKRLQIHFKIFGMRIRNVLFRVFIFAAYYAYYS